MEMKIVGIFVGSDVQGAVGEAKSKGTILFTILIMCIYSFVY